MSDPLLYITDGTTTVNLLSSSGWMYKSWRPTRAAYKGGGTVANSPLANGQRMMARVYDDVIDSFALVNRHDSQDTAIKTTQDLERLLEAATDYWTSPWVATPVWVAIKAPDETNTRYATIKNWSLSGDSDPFDTPFFNAIDYASQPEMILVLEHEIWRETPPGTETAVQVSSQQVYNGVNFGRAATTALEVFVANKHNTANLTHIYNCTAAGAFSANLIGAALPFDIFTGAAAGPANGDMVYFGIDTTVADSGPFTSLAFDILTAAVYGAGDSVALQYYSELAGPAWAAFAAASNWDLTATGYGIVTTPFQRTGVNAITWQQPADWRAVAINGVTAYWVRMVVTEATGISRAQQQNRDIYSVVRNSVDIDDAQVPGDIPALMRVWMEGQTSYSTAVQWGAVMKAWVGVRSVSRGANFRSWLNLSGEAVGGFAVEQNPAGIRIRRGSANVSRTVLPPAAGYNTEGPAEYVLSYAPAGAVAMQSEIQIEFTTASIITEYTGAYRLYLRHKVITGTEADFKVRYALSIVATTGIMYTGAAVTIPTQWVNEWGVIDLGLVRFPGFGIEKVGTPAPFGSTGFVLLIQIQKTTAGAGQILFSDLCMFPVDEWVGVAEAGLSNFRYSIGSRTGVEMSSTHPYMPFVTTHRDAFDGNVYDRWTADAAGPAILQANKDQRLHFLTTYADPTTFQDIKCASSASLKILVERVARYKGARGSR